MNEQSGKDKNGFHKVLIYGILWLAAAFAIVYGIRVMWLGYDNGYRGTDFVFFVIVNGLLILAGLFIIKARFDVAKFHPYAPKELLWAFIIAAVLFVADYWVEHTARDGSHTPHFTPAIVFLGLGIAIYSYYQKHSYLFD